MSGSLIAARGVKKSFGDKQVLRGIELAVAPGQLLGLIGPNGAGKSTLLRSLIGLVARTSGDVAVFGLDPARHGLEIRRRTSYLPGETGVYAQMTGQAFLDFSLGFYARRQQGLQDKLLANFDLPLHQKVRNYSAGMKQKLALVATLVPDVELYLLDEPDRALDATVRFFLRDVLLELKQAGKTIVLSSHHLSEVETLADRLEFLLDGTLVSDQRLQAARTQLRRRPRVRLAVGHALPAGATVIRHEPDDMLVVETDGDAMQWLRAAPADAIRSAELGIDRLEDLYQLLLRDPAATDDAGGRP